LYDIHNGCSKCLPFAATQARRRLDRTPFLYLLAGWGTAHRARETVGLELLIHETLDFIPRSLWPPNSLDLNPVDYIVWGMLQERGYMEKIRTVEELQQRIMEDWERLDQRVIHNTVKQWHKSVAANGGHFEHLL